MINFASLINILHKECNGYSINYDYPFNMQLEILRDGEENPPQPPQIYPVEGRGGEVETAPQCILFTKCKLIRLKPSQNISRNKGQVK